MSPRVVALILVCLFACGKKDDNPKPADSPKVAVDKVPEAPPADTANQEHSGGMARFKDPAVYIDGVPSGVLRFGELPITLKPVWIEEHAAVAFKAGDKGPRYRVVKQRRYRFSDYFRELGVDLAKVKELHLYGGNQKAAAVVISGENLQKIDDFYFRFGGAIWGKPLPACPMHVGDGKCPDQIGSLALYVDKLPPKRDGGYFYFGDKRVEGIPYHGEPIRGGIRVYLDGKLATVIKRNKLEASELPSTGPEGQEEYKLFDFLSAQGVDTNKIQEAWLIEYERRTKKYSRTDLLGLKFQASKGESGEVLIGPSQIPAQAISLHSKTLKPEDLPQLLDEEIEKADG